MGPTRTISYVDSNGITRTIKIPEYDYGTPNGGIINTPFMPVIPRPPAKPQPYTPQPDRIDILRNGMIAMACVTFGLTRLEQRQHFTTRAALIVSSAHPVEKMYELLITAAYEAKEEYPDE